MFKRVVEPQYGELRRNVLAQISAWWLLSKVLDSFELVELTMEVEESGVIPAVDRKTVRDLPWLCKAMNFHRQLKSDQAPG